MRSKAILALRWKITVALLAALMGCAVVETSSVVRATINGNDCRYDL